MLGGEAANDKSLLAKRDKKKQEAEKRLAKLAGVFIFHSIIHYIIM